MAELSLRDLWQACGGGGELRLLIERSGKPPRGVVVETPFALLGSSDEGAVVLADQQVSRRHACLQIIGGRLWCFDLVSRTGTFWGSRRKHAGWFNPADSLRIGPYQVRVFPDRGVTDELVTGGAITSPLKPIPLEQDSLPSATLEFLNAQRPGSAQIPTFHLDRPLTLVGQSPRCKIRFTCPTVSTCHCSLLRTPQGVWVIDLQSREGVAVNGAKVRWARLRDGDCLGIGRFEVLVRVVPRRLDLNPSPSPILNATPVRHESSAAPAAAEPSAPPPAPFATVSPAPTAPDLAPTNSHAGPGADVYAMPASSALARMTPSGALAPRSAESAALLPAHGSAIGPPAGADATQTLMLTFVNQFSMMQQQMFDQFQQTTMMMMQMFGTLHRDQLQLVRQELDGLRELNREIVSLQAELAKHQPGERVGRRPPAATAEPRPAVPPMPASSAPSSPGPTNPGPAKPPLHSELKAAVAAPSTAAAPAEEDVHAWLSQRFNHLQQESKSRWQKLLATVVGQ